MSEKHNPNAIPHRRSRGSTSVASPSASLARVGKLATAPSLGAPLAKVGNIATALTSAPPSSVIKSAPLPYGSNVQGAQVLKLDMVHGQGLQVCTLNVRTLTATGAATLLDKELARLDIGIAGLQEVRWLGSGELSAGDRKFLWSGGPDGPDRQA